MADNNSHINRRSYLKLAGGAAASAALAGCTGDDGEGTETTTTAGGGNETETTTTPSENGDTFDVTITQGQMPSGLDPHDHRETPTTIVVLQPYEGVLT
ncbi:peptide ABC transporter substrate-binding protein, partial [Halorubrum sp. Atlit-9R]